MKKMIIAIDGPSGTGKSTTARLLGERMNIRYIDSGTMYRGITHTILKNDIKRNELKKIIEIAKDSKFEYNNDKVFMNGIDISKEPMLVYPTLHYQNGGLDINNQCETTVPGLYVGGEVSGGVHGENRLMGNSLLDVMVFGRIAGISAATYAKEQYSEGKLSLDHVNRYHQALEKASLELNGKVSPMILPDYSNPDVRKRQLTTQYVGTVR